jgi:hypothetical protein
MTQGAINQDIRYSNQGGEDNPYALLGYIKPTRIVVNAIGGNPPLVNTGEDYWWLLDSDTGNFWYKFNRIWTLFYTFGSGGGSTVDNATNVGVGAGWFLQKAGNLLEFKTITTTPENSATESTLKIYDNTDELNVVAPATASELINYGTASDFWIVDSDNKTQDADGNYIYPFKSVLPLNGISITTQTAGSDKFLTFENTGILNVVNAEVSPGDLVSVSTGVATVKALTAGPGINIQSNPTNLRISAVDSESPQYHFSYQNSISYSIIANQYNNLPPFVSALPDTSDWVFYPNINGSSFVQYVGASGITYNLNYNLSMASTLQTTEFNFLFRIAQGNPLISQSGLPVSGTLIHCPASPSPIIYFSSTSTDILFQPTPNEYYTIQCQSTLAPQQTLQIEELKLVIRKV